MSRKVKGRFSEHLPGNIERAAVRDQISERDKAGGRREGGNYIARSSEMWESRMQMQERNRPEKGVGGS